MSNVLLISYQTLIDNSELNANIDAKIIRPLIKEIQEIKIQPIIGTVLFDKLKEMIDAGTLTEDCTVLINEHIQPTLIHYFLADFPFKSKYRFTNIGTVERTSETSTPVSAEETRQLIDFYKGRAAWYSARLTSYLCANADKFPEYKTTDSDDDLKAKPQQYDSGLYLG